MCQGCCNKQHRLRRLNNRIPTHSSLLETRSQSQGLCRSTFLWFSTPPSFDWPPLLARLTWSLLGVCVPGVCVPGPSHLLQGTAISFGLIFASITPLKGPVFKHHHILRNLAEVRASSIREERWWHTIQLLSQPLKEKAAELTWSTPEPFGAKGHFPWITLPA